MKLKPIKCVEWNCICRTKEEHMVTFFLYFPNQTKKKKKKKLSNYICWRLWTHVE